MAQHVPLSKFAYCLPTLFQTMVVVVVVVVLFYVGVLEPLGGRPRPEEDMPRRSAGPARQC